MKLAIKIEDHYLDLYEDAIVTIELKNPAIQAANPEVLPGSFVLPFRIPMNKRNADILHLAHIIAATPEFNFTINEETQNEEPPIYRGRDCQVIYDGVPLIEGTAYVKKTDNTSAFIHIVVGKMPELKDINLTDIDYGDVIDISAGPTVHAKATAETPANHNHIFFPVRNYEFFSDADPDLDDLPPGTLDHRYIMNFYDGDFVDDPDCLIATPFVKHSYILERIFLHLNYHIDNQFNAVGELANLCLFNNFSIYTESLVWGNEIDYRNHVPSIPASEFVKETAKLFALGLFTAPFISGNTVIKPLRDVLNSEAQKDWTEFIHHQYDIEFDDSPIRRLKFEDSYIEDLQRSFSSSNTFFEPNNYTIVENMTQYNAASEAGYYFILSINQFRYKYPNGTTGLIASRLPSYIDPNIDRDTVLEFKMTPAIPARVFHRLTKISGAERLNAIMPVVNTHGTFGPFSIASNPPLRLLLYRGMQDGIYNALPFSYPMASSNIYNFSETKIADQSLLWQAEEGLYNTFWKEWHYTQRYNKRISRRFNLPLSEIISFNFDQLIHAENQKYMVESMRITLAPKGIRPVDTVMMQINTALFINNIVVPEYFEMIVQTDNSGTSLDNQFTIPLPISGSIYNYTVETSEQTLTNQTGSVTLEWATPGTYYVRITGDFPRILFNNGGDKLKLLEVSNWGNIAWTNFLQSFYGCSNMNITAPDAPVLTGVTIMTQAFQSCSSVNADLSSWDVSTITNMSNMFNGATIFNGDINNWNVSNVTSFFAMFENAAAFNQPIGSWSTTSALNMGTMFKATTFNQPIGGWNVSSVTNMANMFQNSQFNQPLADWVVSSVTTMSSMFSSSGFNQPIGGWNVSSVTTMSSMFSSNTAFNQPLADWVVSSVTNMQFMFSGATAFNQPIGGWNTSSVTAMNSMFSSNTAFNQPIGGWNVSSVTTMSNMFDSATAFNQPLADWVVSSVTNMTSMFRSSGFNQPISGWNTISLTNMTSMFQNSPFNQPIGGWNVSSVTTMTSVFAGATAFNQPLADWVVSSVTTMAQMFQNTPFNQPIGGWNTMNVTSMSFMFSGNSAFDRDISLWEVTLVTNMNGMFNNASTFNQDLSPWCVEQIPTEPTNFATGAAAWVLPKPDWGVAC